MKVYVAGPMSWGDGIANVIKGVRVADELMEAGHIPFLPHVSHLWALVNGQRWAHADWLEYDKAWLLSCGAVVRIPGKSRGADQEERWARRHSIPVFYSVREFLEWADAQV